MQLVAALVWVAAIAVVCDAATGWVPCEAPASVMIAFRPSKGGGDSSSSYENGPMSLQCVNVASGKPVGLPITLAANATGTSIEWFVGAPAALFWINSPDNKRFTPYMLSGESGEVSALPTLASGLTGQQSLSGMAFDVSDDALYVIVGNEVGLELTAYVWRNATSSKVSQPVQAGIISSRSMGFQLAMVWTASDGVLMGITTENSDGSSTACTGSTVHSTSLSSHRSTDDSRTGRSSGSTSSSSTHGAYSAHSTTAFGRHDAATGGSARGSTAASPSSHHGDATRGSSSSSASSNHGADSARSMTASGYPTTGGSTRSKHARARALVELEPGTSVYGCVAFFVTFTVSTGKTTMVSLEEFTLASSLVYDQARREAVSTAAPVHEASRTSQFALITPNNGKVASLDLVSMKRPSSWRVECRVGPNVAFFLPLSAQAQRLAFSTAICSKRGLAPSVVLVANDVDTGAVVSQAELDLPRGLTGVTGFMPQC